MPNPLQAGATANLGVGVVNNNLVITAPGAGTFTVSVNHLPAVPHALGAGGALTVPVNGQAVTVVNTTGGVVPPAGTLFLYF